MQVVTITGAPLTIGELVAVADGAQLELSDEARSTIEASRAVIDRVLQGDYPVYGLNTGVGHMKDTALPVEALRSAQEMLVVTHAGGVGEPLSARRVRAAMAVRVHGITRGGAGASQRVADVLVDMLNAGVHPIAPSRGSVGTGDLGQLASVGEVALGRGLAELGGEVMPGGEALARAGIEPLQLEPKDGLTLMSSNAVTIGDAAFAVSRARSLTERADRIAALSLETVGGNPSIVDPAVGAAKPFPGQIASCAAVRAALEGGPLSSPGAARSVQDPLSFRVIPQVHGALRETVDATWRAVDVELNGRGDNPLVSIGDGTIVHNGNFLPLVMAIAFDHLRIALAHVGQISDRRMSHLWDAFFQRMEAGSRGGEGGGGLGPMFGLTLRYPAAASFSELRQLAAPATLDVPPLDIGVEDHASSAPLAVRKTSEALDLLEEILSIEVLMASDVLATAPSPTSLGVGTGAVAASAREAIAGLGRGAAPAQVQRAVAETLFRGS